MQRRLFLAASLATQLPGATASAAPPPAADRALTRIALGSCADQRDRQPIWDAIHGWRPELMLMAGDNVYGDSFASDLLELREAYLAADRVPGFARMKRELPVAAIWDDHDYGVNDAGAEFPWKQRSKDLFCAFWGVAADDPRRGRDGLFHARIFGPPGRRVQVILLDTRWFRSELKPTNDFNAPGKQRFVPDDDPDKTLLGEAQWRWLAEQLRQPAELRLIVSSIQVLAEGHGWERWGNLPLELTRLTQLINETQANGVIFLSGDRHRAAAYRRIDGTPYPFYELTSSSLNAGVASRQPEIDPQRLGGRLYPGENFGMVQIDWELGVVHLDILTLPAGQRVRGVTLAIAELQH